MQKVLWSIIEKNQLDPDIQIKAIEKLQVLTDKLGELYHSLPSSVCFGASRHYYINKDGFLLSPAQQREIDDSIQRLYNVQYERQFSKKFEEMKRNNPALSDEEISLKVNEELEDEAFEIEDK